MSIISKLLYRTIISCGGIVENNFNKETKNFKKVNEDVLFNILNKNASSLIGERFKFKNILSVSDFKEKMPLVEYSYYEKYIERMANGEKNILITDKVEYFGHTSGTTGKQKLIPVTKSSRLRAAKYMALLVTRFSYNNFKEYWNYGKGLMIADTVKTDYTKGGIPICSATSGGMNSIKSILPYLYTSPYEVMGIKDKEVALYLHVLFGLREKGLLYISGVFISNILDLLRIMEKNSDMLVRDIRKGRLSKTLNIDEETRKALNKYLSPNAARADELEREFKKGFDGICKRVWPNFQYIASVTGANFAIYDDMVNFYTGYSPIYSPCYAATEGIIGINPYGKNIRYVIIPDTVFYEFISSEELSKKNPTTLCADELELGKSYELVITTYSGLYRYRLGDVIKVVGFYNNSPEIEFLYRRNQILNMVSEKTTEEHLTTAIKNTKNKLKLNLIDYTAVADNSTTPGRYKFYFEIKGKITKELVRNIEENLDKELENCNLAYKRFRKKNGLAMTKVIILEEGTFNKVKDFLLTKGVSKNQIKIPRVVTTNKKVLGIIEDNKLL
ncbi:GH3 auxin-responsive promoter family protein [Clostridium sp. AL.422]|uniref:GH3 auxin-responsive promoter family protein n=1 Tax=Clostridium TaxID=1485 RepID=UPI00293DC063|nr:MULTISPECIES: GH3 auxin-responsive promoter family protein [unclassified Clostridium]MDV4151112.1 GH3 auxin-responsive promoter family protein [Clostridium sp. AL.422]